MNQVIWQEKEQLRRELYLQFNQCGELSDEQMENMIEEKVMELSRKRYISIAERQQIKEELFNVFRKLDVLSELLENDEISEIMVNGEQRIFIEKQGKIYQVPEQFASEERLRNVIQQIVSSCNRIVNETVPIVDARLKDGSRVNVVLPPCCLRWCGYDDPEISKGILYHDEVSPYGIHYEGCSNVFREVSKGKI